MVGVQEVAFVEHCHSIWRFQCYRRVDGPFVDTIESLIVSVQFGCHQSHNRISLDNQTA